MKKKRKTELQKALSRIPADALHDMAVAEDDPNVALRMLTMCVAATPHHVPSWMSIAELLETDSAISALSEGHEIAGKHFSSRLKQLKTAAPQHRDLLEYLVLTLRLAAMLEDKGRLKESAELLEEVCVYCDRDYFEIRHILPDIYIRLGNYDRAEEILQQYGNPEEAATLLTKTLLTFRKTGPTSELAAVVAQVHEKNAYVLREIVRTVPDVSCFDLDDKDSEPGSHEEACFYSMRYRSCWRSTAGAISWLRSQAIKLKIRVDDPPEEPEPTPVESDFSVPKAMTDEVAQLPHVDEEWLVSEEAATEGNRVLIAFDVAVAPASLIGMLALDTPRSGPDTPAGKLTALFTLMLQPPQGNPRRPEVVHYLDQKLYRDHRRYLQAAGIEAEFSTEVPPELQDMRSMVENVQEAPEFSVEAFLALPQTDTDWGIDWRQTNILISHPETGQPTRAWVTLVMELPTGIIAGTQASLDPPDDLSLMKTIFSAAFNHMLNAPVRPMRVFVNSGDQRMGLLNAAEQLQFSVAVSDLPNLEAAFDDLQANMTGDRPMSLPGIMAVDGISTKLAEEFFLAAAKFYGSRIWMTTTPHFAVEVRCPELLAGTWYGVVMGQMGQEIGVMFFDDRKKMQEMFSVTEDDDPDRAAGGMQGIAFSLQEQHFCDPDDVAAAEQFGWPVAAPEAWPTGTYTADRSLHPLTTDQIRFLIGALPAVVRILSTGQKTGTTHAEIEGRRFTLKSKLHSLY
ncbi:MAG: hypothetical protein KDA89_18200 [Planctomycetaceae bacterium]|nr:hypothetical protein [Planctomycetaceae bacterium]